MVRLLKDESLITKWQQFFEDHYKGEIETIALETPIKRSLTIDFETLDKYDTKLTELLINKPYVGIYTAEEAIKQIDTVKGNISLHFRIKNPPEYIHRIIREIRATDAGKIITIEGIIKKNTSVKANLQIAAWQCQKCGAVIKTETTEDIIQEPNECYEDQNGCGRISTFKLLANLSSFIDGQKIQIQENPETLKGSEQPEKITAYLEDDITGKLLPGDRVKIIGILHTIPKKQGNSFLKSFDYAIDVINYEIKETAYEDIQITEEDIQQIKQISKDPDLYKKMRHSIAPSIYGMETEKEALVLQLFGGNRKITTDETIIRGDIHILLTGDPSTAKSQLIKYIDNLAPRSILASGSGSTKAGLTAAAVKDEFSENQWTLEAGALVLANDGIACIDEFDKMSDEDRGGMHQAMEQQEISIAKAGINVKLRSKCSVLAAANPKFGRYDEAYPIYEQINLTPALISRFDLIYIIIDKPNREKDTELSKYILKTHQNPQGKQILPVFDKEFLRKYIAYAKQNIQPELTDEAMEVFQDFYVDFRNNTKDSISLTPRQLEAWIRLSEASAKMRLSDKVTVEDAKRAIKIFDEYLKRVGIDRETGIYDIDVIETGVSHSQHDRMNIIIKVIKNLSDASKNGYADRNDVIQECEIEGLEISKVEDGLDFLKRNGQIFEPIGGRYRCAN